MPPRAGKAQHPAWARRPSTAVAKLAGRPLLLLSVRDLLLAAAAEQGLLVSLLAPAPAAMAGFAAAARALDVPLLLARPSGAPDELGPQEGRDDAAFVEWALQAVTEAGFSGPLALLKEAPRSGSAIPEQQRVQREIEAGFTGIGITAQADSAESARDAALVAAAAAHLELGLEVVPLGGNAAAGAQVARDLRARGTAPSAVRVSGIELSAAQGLGRELLPIALSSEAETSAGALAASGIRLLTASGPFLRALARAAPPALLDELQGWADGHGATLEQAAARHQKRLRELAPEAQARLEALASFEASELFARAGLRGSGSALLARLELLGKEG